MSNQKQPGSRSRSSIGLYGELARAIDADRQREAEDYRLIRQARDARAGRDRAARPRWWRRLRPSFARSTLEGTR